MRLESRIADLAGLAGIVKSCLLMLGGGFLAEVERAWHRSWDYGTEKGTGKENMLVFEIEALFGSVIYFRQSCHAIKPLLCIFHICLCKNDSQ